MVLVIRFLFLFAILVVIAGLAAWFSEKPGSVTLEWQGWRIDTSVGVLVLLVALVFAAGAILYQIWRAFRRLPRAMGQRRESRRREQGYLALTRGMVAIAAGDTEEARRQAKRANDILNRPAGALLIGAQAAQMEGRAGVARKFYDAMLEDPETELLGVRGLLTLAERAGDTAQALSHAERAYKLSPRTPWVLTRLFGLQVKARKWEAAEQTLREAIRARAVAAEDGKREDAVLLVQLSLMAERSGDKRLAQERARKARAADPDLLPAALQLASLQHADGRDRAARKLIEETYAARPHPDLVRLYLLTGGKSAPLDRLRVVERLAALAPDHRESHLALARANLDADLWGQARRHLTAGGGETPDAAFCRLYAELEQRESGDAAAARDWLSRAADAPSEPGWICNSCGAIARDWSALCGHCGAFDSLRWDTPPRVMALPDTATLTEEGREILEGRAPSGAVLADGSAGPPPAPDTEKA